MSYSYGPKSLKSGILTIYPYRPVWDESFETIERKGAGHPDTIADILASNISQKYSLYTWKNCDKMILHHQIDKLMIIGGRTKVYFGGGEFLNPIKIIVAGRATYCYGNKTIPVDGIVAKTIYSYFKKNYPMINPRKDIEIENCLTNFAGPGTITTSAGAISRMFNPRRRTEVRGYEKYVSNDTSYCVSYYPYSVLEEAVLSLEQYLSSKKIKKTSPWLGTDIKIMAVRDGFHVDMTICIPQISSHVRSLNEYWKNLENIGSIIDKFLHKKFGKYNFNISINTKDDYDKFNVYMTFTGSSLSGDIGVVGRGNRINGLITSNRPMSTEGSCGKNPRYYSGFMYAVLAKIISQELYSKLGEPSIVEIVSQNGGDLVDPWRSRIICASDQKKIQKIFLNIVKDAPKITLDFINGKIKPYE